MTTIKKIQVFLRSEFEDDCPTFTGNDIKVTYRAVSNNWNGVAYTPSQEPALIIWNGQEQLAAFNEYLYWKKIE